MTEQPRRPVASYKTYTEQPRRPVASYKTYKEAERSVDHLSDQGFPVEGVAIIGQDLRLVEQVIGRMDYGRAALHGAASGALPVSRAGTRWSRTRRSPTSCTAARRAAYHGRRFHSYLNERDPESRRRTAAPGGDFSWPRQWVSTWVPRTR
ncbi:general stress protein [Streptomyces sp. NPDC056549]|uniref:general stress protein n=1 Tax=Streptomyces sp. NPDC056549 TaxID=3345864 RepID=UPI0036803627